MFKKFKYRSEEEEIIDDFSLSGEIIENTFNTIESINYWLGGNSLLKHGVKIILERSFDRPDKKAIKLLDLGCGSGDGLRALAAWARKSGQPLRLIGVDANDFVVAYARKKSKHMPEISYLSLNIFDPALNYKHIDIVTCNLFLHHFSEQQQLEILQRCVAEGVKAILINDLHRHWLAHFLFNIICRIFRAPEIARKDGLLSIRKGFRRRELEALVQQLGDHEYRLKWKWAFRYQLLLFLD